jgi:hypothetical protein
MALLAVADAWHGLGLPVNLGEAVAPDTCVRLLFS